ncbi:MULTISPECIES: ABC transporter permease [Loigolactobacillus]|uniref:Spermidine/putrescine ABC transporter permease n=1 Tax=Loigolactobacillus backii TaxID=375175 RepID=A0A192H4Y8_9LACO|nr:MULTISPECIES: ABC transporter permease [Loigolactobacillus]ANK59942.1 spermidine/putrescine ABC transporter permease [Loigolactobacillus backii]ANK63277.1 spermidine/putrescine ABC transporter permease [Loigolactobacillus backii]ANK64876.1 spermidine/putrescine ABC transporter permease [Loigolactobacillus backii]ANK66677.1 spermidine/putrescine ABC transporter permease [Loigolactobacillus backii]ANK69717.1 spermidine/putrescine ABC transporter permease [Loigolactobacillus backii]
MKKRFSWQNLYLIFVFALLYVPIFYLIFYSFNRGGTMTHFTGFTWQHYTELFSDSRMIEIVVDTLLIALLSSLLATIIGTLGALQIYSVKRPVVKNAILSLNNILMVSPDVIIGASFLIFFTFLGFKLGFGSVLLSHIAFSIPIVVLMVLPKLNEMNLSLIDAATDLGATNFQVFSRVILPYIAPGVFAGYFMAFTYSLDDFAVTFFVTGNGFETLSVEIYARARQGISLEINALSALMFVFSLLLVVGYYFLNQYNSSKRTRKRQRLEATQIK